MPVTVDRLPGRILVLQGVDSPPALAHLSRALIRGSAFTDFRGLVVDLGGVAPDAEQKAQLEAAVEGCLRRRQVVAVSADEARRLAGFAR